MELTEDRRTLSSGQEADGLLIVAVAKNSPAAEAGLHAYSNTKHDVITGVAMAGAMFFPPAILLIPALDYTAIGQSYDLIIGVDGSRVRNFLDFQDRTRNLQPGETIYLSVVRDGKRLQITVPLPAAPPNMTQAATK
jgi:S1-C subfamily serine protease